MGYDRQSETDEEGLRQPGPLTETIELLNLRWTLHILRALLGGKLRFNELVRGLGVNACTLRDRLRLLERKGIVERNVVSAFPPKVEYSLTEKGMALHRVFEAIEEWGTCWLDDGRRRERSAP
jgi:DNA-binding HxlR family transcriptional regulator